MTFLDLVNQVKDYTGLTSPEAVARISAAINRHYRRVTSEIGMDATRFVTRTAATTLGGQTVTFTSIEKIDRVLDVTDATALRALDEVSIHQLRTQQPESGQGTVWALQNTAGTSVTIRLNTIPQEVYQLQADGWTSLSDLSGWDTPAFPASFHDVLAWFVISEELLKKEKDKLAKEYRARAEQTLSNLKFHLADSHTHEVQQASQPSSILGGGGGTGGGNSGGSSYAQTGLITFDRDTDAPFAVTANSAKVDNLDADLLDGESGAAYHAPTNLTPLATDRLLGRDTVGTGVVEAISVGGGLEFTGAAAIQRSALTGDVTASAGSNALTIAVDAVTYAKMQNVSATDKLLGRSTAGAGNVEEITLTAAGRALLDDAAASNQRTTLGLGALAVLATVGTTQLDADAVTYPKLQNVSAASRLLGRGSAGGAGDPEEITLGAGLTMTATSLDITPVTSAVRVLNRDVTTQSVSSTTTETTVYTYAVAGGTLGSTKQLRLTLIGKLKQDVASTFTVKVKFGATTLFDTGAITIADAGGFRAVLLDVVVSAWNATGAQVARGALQIGANNSGIAGAAAATDAVRVGVHDAVTEDSTASKDLVVTVQHSVSSSDAGFTFDAAVLELLD